MAKNILIVGLLFVLSCSSDSKINKEKTKLKDTVANSDKLQKVNYSIYNETKFYKIEPSTQQEFDDANKKYEQLLNTDKSQNVIVKDGVISIYIANGELLTFSNVNSSNEVDEKIFVYVGEIKPLKYYVITSKYWEGTECILINANNGDKDTMWTLPYVSPQQSYIACKSAPFGMDGVPNGLQIFKVQTNDLIRHIEINQQFWVPDRFVWKTDNEIIIRAVLIDDYYRQHIDNFIYLALIIIE